MLLRLETSCTPTDWCGSGLLCGPPAGKRVLVDGTVGHVNEISVLPANLPMDGFEQRWASFQRIARPRRVNCAFLLGAASSDLFETAISHCLAADYLADCEVGSGGDA